MFEKIVDNTSQGAIANLFRTIVTDLNLEKKVLFNLSRLYKRGKYSEVLRHIESTSMSLKTFLKLVIELINPIKIEIVIQVTFKDKDTKISCVEVDKKSSIYSDGILSDTLIDLGYDVKPKPKMTIKEFVNILFRDSGTNEIIITVVCYRPTNKTFHTICMKK